MVVEGELQIELVELTLVGILIDCTAEDEHDRDEWDVESWIRDIAQ